MNPNRSFSLRLLSLVPFILSCETNINRCITATDAESSAESGHEGGAGYGGNEDYRSRRGDAAGADIVADAERVGDAGETRDSGFVGDVGETRDSGFVGDAGNAGDADDTENTYEEAFNRISNWIDTKFPWGQENIEDQKEVFIDAIIKACGEFAPPEDDWLYWCQAHITVSACYESSFNPDFEVPDAYGGETDPTVGLLQIRFSNVVRDFDKWGPRDALKAVGCDWPDFQSVSDWRDEAHNYMDFMKGVRCNIALGTWFYYVHATSNGGVTLNPNTGETWGEPCYVSDYCSGECPTDDVPRSTLAIGLLSFGFGSNGFVFDPDDPYENEYVTQTKTWFDNLIPVLPDPHPFIRPLDPNPQQYCE